MYWSTKGGGIAQKLQASFREDSEGRQVAVGADKVLIDAEQDIVKLSEPGWVGATVP